MTRDCTMRACDCPCHEGFVVNRLRDSLGRLWTRNSPDECESDDGVHIVPLVWLEENCGPLREVTS